MDALAPVVPPAPPVHAADLPLWRYLPMFIGNSLDTYPDYAFDKLVVRARMLGVDNVGVSEPEAIRHVLLAGQHRYRRPIASIRAVRPLAGAGVLLSEGDAWRRQRRSLASIFTPASVESLLPHFQQAAEDMVRGLAGRGSANLSAVFHGSTLDAVLRALFSLEPDEAGSGLAAMVRRYITGAGRPNLLDGLARAEGDFGFAGGSRRRFQAAWFARVDTIVARRRGELNEGGRDLLDLLIAARDPETGEPLDDAEIRDQAATMLFAGFETTSRLLFWASYLLCLDQAEQLRIRAEIADFRPDRVSRLADLARWPRLRQTLLEALRLYPPAAHILREAIEPDTILGEAIEPGTRVWISPWVVHRHRRLWEQPTAFIPDRFAGQPSPWIGGAFIPFGVGPRICIGASFAMAEAQIMLATLLSRYEIALADDRPVLPVASVTTAPHHEPLFTLTPV